MIVTRNLAKLLIEGIEVPFLSASVSISINDFPTCSFSIPPIARALDIDYRSIVHVLVWMPSINDYGLVFEGEIAKRGYNFTQGSSRAEFTAVSLFNHMAQLELMSMAYDQLCGHSQMYMAGVSQTISAPPTDLLAAMNSSKNSGNITKDVLTGILNIIRQGFTNETLSDSHMMYGRKPTFFYKRGLNLKTMPGDETGSQRFAVVNTTMADNMIKTEVAQNTFKNFIETTNTKMTRWEFVRMIADTVMYDILLPPGNLQNSFILKPQAHFADVPKCNVIFPNMVSGFSYSEDFLSEPTRLCATVSTVMAGDGLAASLPGLYAPDGGNGSSLGKAIMAIKSVNDNKGVLPQTGYEQEYGIKQYIANFQNDYTNQAIMQMVQRADYASEAIQKEVSGNVPLSNMEALLQKLLEVEYHRSRHASKQGSFYGPFNPFLMPGFPVMILKGAHDPKYTDPSKLLAFCGYLANVTHTIDPSGGSITTSGYTQYMRPAVEAAPLLPSWAQGSNISGVYKQLLGTSGAIKQDIASAQSVYAQFIQNQPSTAYAMDFATSYNNRAMGTLSTGAGSLKSFYGISSSSAAKRYDQDKQLDIIELDSSLFNKLDGGRRRAIVRRYADELKSGPILLGV